MKASSIKVGVIAEQTGALSFAGIADVNVARMVIDDINAKGGLLGRQIELYLEDGATTDSVAEAKAAKLVQQEQVDVLFGGIYSSTRQAIKGPGFVRSPPRLPSRQAKQYYLAHRDPATYDVEACLEIGEHILGLPLLRLLRT